jgi:hypothetical protein
MTLFIYSAKLNKNLLTTDILFFSELKNFSFNLPIHLNRDFKNKIDKKKPVPISLKLKYLKIMNLSAPIHINREMINTINLIKGKTENNKYKIIFFFFLKEIFYPLKGSNFIFFTKNKDNKLFQQKSAASALYAQKFNLISTYYQEKKIITKNYLLTSFILIIKIFVNISKYSRVSLNNADILKLLKNKLLNNSLEKQINIIKNKKFKEYRKASQALILNSYLIDDIFDCQQITGFSKENLFFIYILNSLKNYDIIFLILTSFVEKKTFNKLSKFKIQNTFELINLLFLNSGINKIYKKNPFSLFDKFLFFFDFNIKKFLKYYINSIILKIYSKLLKISFKKTDLLFYYNNQYLTKNLIKKSANQTASILLIYINLYYRFCGFFYRKYKKNIKILFTEGENCLISERVLLSFPTNSYSMLHKFYSKKNIINIFSHASVRIAWDLSSGQVKKLLKSNQFFLWQEKYFVFSLDYPFKHISKIKNIIYQCVRSMHKNSFRVSLLTLNQCVHFKFLFEKKKIILDYNKQLWLLKKKKHNHKSLFWIFKKYWFKTAFKVFFFKKHFKKNTLKNFATENISIIKIIVKRKKNRFFFKNLLSSNNYIKIFEILKKPESKRQNLINFINKSNPSVDLLFELKFNFNSFLFLKKTIQLKTNFNNSQKTTQQLFKTKTKENKKNLYTFFIYKKELLS